MAIIHGGSKEEVVDRLYAFEAKAFGGLWAKGTAKHISVIDGFLRCGVSVKILS